MMINLALSSICRQVFKILQHEYIQYIYIYSLQRCPDLHGLHAGREARVDAAPPQDPHRLQRGLLPPGSAHVLEGGTPLSSCLLAHTKYVTGRDSPLQSVRQQMLLLPTATLTH